jgi:hypothetical protein
MFVEIKQREKTILEDDGKLNRFLAFSSGIAA